MAKHLKVCDFTKPELDFIESLANFTPCELEYFRLRSRGKSNVEISLTMHISERTASNLAKAVNRKIIKVL